MATKVQRGVEDAGLEPEPAFEILYGQYQRFIRGALQKHYVGPEELDDVMQEVFVVLLRRIDEASSKRSLGSWLSQVARRVAANHHRAARRRARKHDAIERSPDASVGARRQVDPEQHCARQEAVALVRDFLESLDEEACAVFVMSEIEGLRGAEIASRLGLTLPMTYARIRAVRDRFGRLVAQRRRSPLAVVLVPIRTAAAAVSAAFLATGWRLKAAGAALLLAIITLLAIRPGSGGGGSPAGKSGPVMADADDSVEASRLSKDPATLALTDARPTAFGGIVVDYDPRQPVANAVVCADRPWHTDHFLTDPPACTVTDASGRFEIPGADPQIHTVEAMASGFLPGRFKGRSTDGVEIVLRRGGELLSGAVEDLYGGPIEGAWVSVENRADSTLGATVRTDENGEFALWVAAGPVSLGVGASGYATAYSVAQAPSKEVRIELGAESVIAGVTIDAETGRPLSGVRVSAELAPTPDKYGNRQGVTFSDDRGRWEIRGLQPNHYVLDAATQDTWGRAQRSIDLGVGDRRDGIRVEMMAGAKIDGRIVDTDTGEPCAEGTAVTQDEAQSISRGDRATVDGHVTVPSLTGNAVYSIAVSCRGYQPEVFEVDLRDGPVPRQTWPLTRGSDLVVQVVGERGESLASSTVTLTTVGDGGPRPSAAPIRMRTEPDGTATFSGLSAGLYSLTARGAGHAPAKPVEVDVRGSRSEVRLQAPAGSEVTGSVATSNGQPVGRALVLLGRSDSDPHTPPRGRPHSEHSYQAVTDRAGRFRHVGVPAGAYGVWVVPSSGAPAYLRPGGVPGVPDAKLSPPGPRIATVTVSDTPAFVELELDGLRSIAGAVRGDDGDLVADARVFVARHESDGRLGPRSSPQLTDELGHYRFDDLLEGTYTLIAYRPGGGIATTRGVSAGNQAADLLFLPTGQIAGQVRDADGAAVRAFGLLVSAADEDTRHFAPVGSIEGRYLLDGLEAGRYFVRASAPQGVGEATVELGPGQARDGIDITLDPARAGRH